MGYTRKQSQIEKLDFLRRQDVPKIWIFWPTLTQIYPMKMTGMKKVTTIREKI